MIQTYAVVTNRLMLGVRAWNGHLTTSVSTTYLYSLGGLALGVIAGNWAFKHIPNKIFSYIVYAYIAVCGAIILISA